MLKTVLTIDLRSTFIVDQVRRRCRTTDASAVPAMTVHLFSSVHGAPDGSSAGVF